MKGKILIVEDEEAIASFVSTALEREGFDVEIVVSGERALDRLDEDSPQLVLLDIMLPGVDGLEVCQRIRARSDYIPIIMLTAREEEVDRIVGLEIGADDYITKPFSARELVARVRAVIRLIQSQSEHREEPRRLVIDDQLQIDLEGRVVWIGDRQVEMAPKEFDILALMAQNRGRVFGRDSLLERVWGYDYLGDSRTVDVHIQRLRKKIEPDTQNPKYILTIRTVGYKFAKRPQS
jgi:DNA-binding response OmpR family regulator